LNREKIMRIGSNLHGSDLSALSNLNKIFQQIALATNQISTGMRINSGRDDPAGLAAIESMQSDLAAIDQAARNASIAHYSMAITDAGMGQTFKLMQGIRANVVAAADGALSDAGRAALQLEVDSALQQIDQIGAGANFAGRKLLDGGTLEFQVSPDPGGTVSLQMPKVSSADLGGAAGALSDLASGGSANLQDGDLKQAQAILDQAQLQLLAARANAGSFDKYTLDNAAANLDSMHLSQATSLSDIRDTDFAQATSQLIRTEILARSLFTVVKAGLQNRGMALDLLKQ
jgi:flagellin